MSPITHLTGAARARVGGGPRYTGSRYVPRYDAYRPTGTTYDPALGYYTGEPFETSMPSYATEVTLTDQGSASANRTALVNAITTANGASHAGGYAIWLDTVATHWGDEIVIGQGSRTGWLIIAPLSVKNGTFARGVGKRIQDSDTGLAPFRLKADAGWGSPYGGNQHYRCCIRVSAAASKVRLIGLDCQPDATWAAGLAGGLSSYAYAQAGFITAIDSVFSGLEADFTTDVVIDRCRIKGRTDKPFHRGVRYSGHRIAVINSRIEAIGGSNGDGDAQCINCSSGQSGHIYRNNYIAPLFGEGIMPAAGADVVNEDGTYKLTSIPTDFLIDGNFFEVPASYYAAGGAPKNLLESKMMRNGIVQRNVFKGYRGALGGQNYCISLKASVGGTRYVILMLNHIKDSSAYIGWEATNYCELRDCFFDGSTVPDDYTGSRPTAMTYTLDEALNNVKGNALDGLTIEYNTFAKMPNMPAAQRWMQDGANARIDWRVQHNILELVGRDEDDGIQDDYLNRAGGGAATSYAGVATTGSAWGGNVISGAITAAKRINTDVIVRNRSDLQLDSNRIPTPGGVCDGKGPDRTLLAAATANTETGL